MKIMKMVLGEKKQTLATDRKGQKDRISRYHLHLIPRKKVKYDK